MPSRPSICVLGSTGTIGKWITLAFAGNCKLEQFRRVAVFTSPSTQSNKQDLLQQFKSGGIEVIVGDLANDEVVSRVFEGFDVIISCLGRNVLHLQPHLADLIADLAPLPNGRPRRFYPSEYGTDIDYDPLTSPHEKPHQNKLRTRAHIESLASKGKIEYTYIVTGPFLDTFIYARAGGRACYNAQAGTFGIIGSQDPKEQHIISGTTYADTGRLVYESILTPDASRNATLRVSSISATPADIHAAVQNIVGQKVEPKYTPLGEFKKLEKEAWEKAPDSATVFTLTRIWFEGGSDFTKKPKATYLSQSGKQSEDKELEKELWKNIVRKDTEQVLRELLETPKKA